MFKDASSIESVVWDMKLADLPRSTNRALINELFNGEPPYSDAEQQENGVITNVNWLDSTKIAHDARQQFSQAFTKPGNFFSVRLDSGPMHRRREWSDIITTQINRRMKRSAMYDETLREVFAQVVLHGVGPVTWDSRDAWTPKMQMIGDVLIPSQTKRSMENLPYFAVFRRYTAKQLYRMTHGPAVDKGWNMPVVNACLEWAHKQRGRTNSSNDQVYSPEKIAEDIKADQGFYQSDAVPTIDCWDFYFLDDSSKQYGWKRRIVLDTPSPSEAERGNMGDRKGVVSKAKNVLGNRNQYLFDPGNRNYASKLSQIIHFQYADGSVVAPFRYHSVRSLGFLLYAVCHIQNRLRCKLNDNALENLMQYFRVANPDDVDRLKKVDLINYGIIPDGLQMIGRNERWQVDPTVIQAVMQANRQSMAENSTSFTQDFGHDPSRGEKEKTATQVAAEVNKSQAMVGAMLNDAYNFQTFQDIEIARRFCKKNSKDADVRKFRVECLKRGVPEEMLDHERWDIRHERVIGSGNKQIELAQTRMLMEQIDRYDPDSQRIILRDFTAAATDDAERTEMLVPLQQNQVTDSIHDAQLSAGSMMLGIRMGLKQGVNHGEYAATLIAAIQSKVEEIMASGGVAPAPVLAGLENTAGQTIDGQPVEGNGAVNHINILAQDKSAKQEVKALNDALGNVMNEVKGMAQRLAEQQEAAQQQSGGVSPEAQAKVAERLMLAEVKASANAASHQQKLEQRQQSHELEQANRIRATQVDESVKDLTAQGEIRRKARETMEQQAAEEAVPA